MKIEPRHPATEVVALEIFPCLQSAIVEVQAAAIEKQLWRHLPGFIPKTEIVDVAVGDDQIETPIEMEVDGMRSEAEHRPRRLDKVRLPRGVFEEHVSPIQVQRGVL